MSYKNEKSLKEVLDNLIQKQNWKGGIEKAGVEDAWRALMGKAVQTRTQSVYFNDGRLFVKLTSTTLKQELFYSKDTILSRLNETLGQNLVDEVVFL